MSSAGQWQLAKKYWRQILRGSSLGTLVGALPGAGADIAAWMSYAVSKKFSKEPQKFGTGHVEGIVESGSANNSALAGAWIPALVFGIPGDSITAIVIGVLYMKNMNPGPDAVHHQSAKHLCGVPAVHHRQHHHGAARHPVHQGGEADPEGAAPRPDAADLVFCIVGTFAINNSVFDVGVMLAAGVIAYLLEETAFR